MNPLRFDYLDTKVEYGTDFLKVGDQYVMHEWERPLIKRMIEDLRLTSDDSILEVGFGMGISASIIEEYRPFLHTIVEPHPVMLRKAEQWIGKRSHIKLCPGYWQNYKSQKKFSAIFFDPFCDTADDVIRENLEFLDYAANNLLVDNGRLSIFWIHPFLSEEYQRIILKFYKRFEVSGVPVTPRDTSNPVVDANDTMLSVILYK